MTTIATVVGARPQFVKAAPVSRALRVRFDEYLIHTGQHYDDAMSEVFFTELGIPRPDVDLGIGSGPHGRQTGRMLEAIEGVLVEQRPDMVVVYGDTNSTLAGALAAAKLNIPVAHVEAGLRSGRRDMPEEVNRVVTDHVAELLLCPTQTAVDHLRGEGITQGVVLTGDVMADALEAVRPHLHRSRLATLGIPFASYAVATVHRAENVDHRDRLEAALRVLGAVPGPVVVPVHPRTAAAIDRVGLKWPDNVTAIDPVGYLDMLTLVQYADVVLTDSGGLQKEAVGLGTRCLTLRPETEWPETMRGGWNTLVDVSVDRMMDALKQPEPTAHPSGYLAGASERVVDSIAGHLAG
jgi:UDP-N-acetylglucosamine 2-epimerase